MKHRTPTRRRPLLGLSGLGLALAILAGSGVTFVQPEPAEACTVRSSGRTRACSLTEALAECLQDANDAYWRCRGPNPGWFRRIRCEIMATVDQAGCLTSSPLLAMGPRIFG